MNVLLLLSVPGDNALVVAQALRQELNVFDAGSVAMLAAAGHGRSLCGCGAMLAECDFWRRVEARVVEESAAQSPELAGSVTPKEPLSSFVVADNPRVRSLDAALIKGLPYGSLIRALTHPGIRRSIKQSQSIFSAIADLSGARWCIDTSNSIERAIHLYLRDRERVRVLLVTQSAMSGIASGKSTGIAAEIASENASGSAAEAGSEVLAEASSERVEPLPNQTAAEHGEGAFADEVEACTRLLEKWLMPAHWRWLDQPSFTTCADAWLPPLLQWLDADREMPETPVEALRQAHAIVRGPTHRRPERSGPHDADDTLRAAGR